MFIMIANYIGGFVSNGGNTGSSTIKLFTVDNSSQSIIK